jgi:hypothetical protein
MLNPETRLRPNDAEVAAKVVDGEAIMINLSNGIYYSLGHTGGLMWELLVGGRSLAQTSRTVAERYDVSTERAEADVERLAAELLRENLVTVAPGDGPSGELPPASAGGRAAYEAPKLEIFRDLGHLIALDPPMPGMKDVAWHEPGQAHEPGDGGD